MAFHWCDTLHTTVFTPRDFQVELLATSFERNTIICLRHKSSKEFIALKLLQEITRQTPQHDGKISIYISKDATSNNVCSSSSICTMLKHLTDLKVWQENQDLTNDTTEEFNASSFNVCILKPATCLEYLRSGKLCIDKVHLLVLDECHDVAMYQEVLPIIDEYIRPIQKTTGDIPKILGLAGPLHSAGCALEELSAMLNTLEDNILCKTETASDIVTVLRYCAKPYEFIVQCAPFEKDELTFMLEDIIKTRIVFLKDHRYDPYEIYGGEQFLDELKDIPDPKEEPLKILESLLAVLYEMGPWGADRVAVSMYQRIEKQKIKTPHERHYLLFGVVSTALLLIHTLCEKAFQKIPKHKEIVDRYSSPKVKRLLEVLRLFKPADANPQNETMRRIKNDLEKTDFQKLTHALEFKCQSVENVEKQQMESRSIVENLDPILKQTDKEIFYNKTKGVGNVDVMNIVGGGGGGGVGTNSSNQRHHHSSHKRHHHHQNTQNSGRPRRRIFMRRQHRGGYGDMGDTVCAIIYCNQSHIARVLFELLSEMSRNDEDFKFLRCQYTTDRVADPVTEPKDAEAEHRRQEDVLKRFRMHDCNILIGTSVLEEGIDVPKCNLVVRWDPPTTYRSYVQCKGRARAVPAYHVILVAPSCIDHDHNNSELTTRTGTATDQLNDNSHSFVCRSNEKPPSSNGIHGDSEDSDEESSTSNNDEDENGLNKSNQYTFGSYKGTVKILNPEILTTKPPTASEITLKEISDDTATIAIEEVVEKAAYAIEDIKKEVTIVIKDVDAAIAIEEIKEESAIVIEEVEEKAANDIEEIKEEAAIIIEELVEKATIAIEDGKQNEPKFIKNIEAKIEANFNMISLEEVLDELKGSLKSSSSNSKKNDTPQKIKKKRFECELTTNDKIPPTPSDTELENKFIVMVDTTHNIVDQLAQYRKIEKILLEKCANTEPSEEEHQQAECFTDCVASYKPLPHLLTGASVDLSSAIALVNKYCSKLPSDTFTKLTALWRTTRTQRNGVDMYQCTLRLPINSPLKCDIVGLPMISQVLARRMVALQACIDLHKMGELDNNLQPIGKEGFRAMEADWENFELEHEDERVILDNMEPRPGTTKRRQYYYKRIASEFCDCRPVAGEPCYLYLLDLTLECPIPEEQNTRGRKVYPPEDAQQGFGILTLKRIPKVSSFPIFTRSGEVKVSIVLAKDRIILTEKEITCINTFLNYTFTNVLRLKKFLMLFDPDSTENCVFIVPTIKTPEGKIIDWDFLRLIEDNINKMPTAVPDEERKAQDFDSNKFKDAVVMPWYRNQDQPQYFYVAEICPQLSPLSCFPGDNYRTFKHYYHVKYGLTIQNAAQPLLDVDHTSARLNFLTPRYVNRKGVALPTSSEATKRAKRENLEQKQILVPELCTVHPFPASLWRTAVCLPCILYRINGLLLADDIRKKVSADIALGQQEIEISSDFEWPMLDFGWSLSDVLNKSRDSNAEIKGNEATENEETKAKDAENGKNDEKTEKKSANELVIEGEQRLQDNDFIEIGTWSNDMANDISTRDDCTDDDEDEEYMKYMPPNVTFCDQQMRYGSPTFWNVGNAPHHNANSNGFEQPKNKSRNHNQRKNSFSYYSDDSFSSSYGGDGDYNQQYSSEDDEEDSGHIEFTSKNEAETIETEQEIAKRNKQLSIIQETNANERIYQETKNQLFGYNFGDSCKSKNGEWNRESSIQSFTSSVETLRTDILSSGMLVNFQENVKLLQQSNVDATKERYKTVMDTFKQLLPYATEKNITEILSKNGDDDDDDDKVLTVENFEQLNRIFIESNPEEQFTVVGCGDVFDKYNDHSKLNTVNKQLSLNFEKPKTIDSYTIEELTKQLESDCNLVKPETVESFSFDYQPDLDGHPGPSPSIILQALTMSNANDGINLERLETIGDSFLKYAITTYLYVTYENVHEGKLSHLRSKQVANLNLYRLGRRKMMGEYMIATKFEPHDNWLPPCYYVPKELEKELIEAKIPPQHWKLVDLLNIKKLSSAEICAMVREKADTLGLSDCDEFDPEEGLVTTTNGCLDDSNESNDFTCFIPYNLVTQHSIPDKSIADCVEALIGAYLIECGPRGALLFMAWLGIRVLPYESKKMDPQGKHEPGSTRPDDNQMITVYGAWPSPRSPMLCYAPNANQELTSLLAGFDGFETILGYKFRDRSYLLQAMTHASYTPNRLTDCYQRLEFLGDAVLDYLITRHLYEDPRQHSPGALTDLRSALVNNTIFASLAVRHGFHKYFRHLSPGLNEVIDRFVRIQEENGHIISEEHYLLSEEECDDAEDVEVPKALGDVFESIAGAIFLDSNMSLDVVWQVYSNMMKPEIEQFSNSVPKSPIRELLELEPETAKFGKPEKLADGRRVRVTVEVFCKGTFRGIGRNYRIAKCTAAKCALRQLKKQGLITKKD